MMRLERGRAAGISLSISWRLIWSPVLGVCRSVSNRGLLVTNTYDWTTGGIRNWRQVLRASRLSISMWRGTPLQTVQKLGRLQNPSARVMLQIE